MVRVNKIRLHVVCRSVKRAELQIRRTNRSRGDTRLEHTYYEGDLAEEN